MRRAESVIGGIRRFGYFPDVIKVFWGANGRKGKYAFMY